MRDNRKYILGIDAGGTKTLAVVADSDGRILGIGRAGGGNFQSAGTEGAARAVGRAVSRALSQARIKKSHIVTACYGISGADRPKDFQTIRKFLAPITPTRRYTLVNDTIIALRAGTPDGVGIGLIAGTGNNAIGRNRKGKIKRVGGLGRPLGDFGSASDIAECALSAAMRGFDGRGRPTILYKMICRFLGLKNLEDAIEFFFTDTWSIRRGGVGPDVGQLAFLVFEAARKGDRVAQEILRNAGKEIARAASVVMRSLFRPSEEVPIVLGGSVFQKGSHPALIRSLRVDLPRNYKRVRLITLDTEPVLGAVFFCLDALHGSAGPSRMDRARDSFRRL